MWQVMDFEPDVICLQEVDEGLYSNFFVKHLVSCEFINLRLAASSRRVDYHLFGQYCLPAVAYSRFVWADPLFLSAWDQGASWALPAAYYMEGSGPS